MREPQGNARRHRRMAFWVAAAAAAGLLVRQASRLPERPYLAEGLGGLRPAARTPAPPADRQADPTAGPAAALQNGLLHYENKNYDAAVS
ncbi:MAG: hypothetical protein FJX77_13755, partial [Armatimonadetes bacterium]|nr:hypothetical protein [Armatimonadota bacterium]